MAKYNMVDVPHFKGVDVLKDISDDLPVYVMAIDDKKGAHYILEVTTVGDYKKSKVELSMSPAHFKHIVPKQQYTPTCRFGCTDCVNDPNYIRCYHPEWHNKLEVRLAVGAVCMRCVNAESYDDEDK